MKVTAFSTASRFVGIKETPGPAAQPFISWALSLVGQGWAPSDEIPWCSAFAFAVAWILDIPRPSAATAAAARSWLAVGTPIALEEARAGFDIIVLERGGGGQPGPEVLDAPGHVGFFSALGPGTVWILGGNQGDAVSVAAFDVSRVLGVRRLAWE